MTPQEAEPKAKGDWSVEFMQGAKRVVVRLAAPRRRKLHIACGGAFCATGALISLLLLSEHDPLALGSRSDCFP